MLERIKAIKTTVAGVLLLVGLAANYAYGVLEGTDSGITFKDVIAAAGGIGLIFSK